MFHTQRQVMEAVRSLDGLFLQYRQCVRDHETEKEKFRGMFGVWTEELMRAAEKQGIDKDEEQAVVLETDGLGGGVDDSGVVAEVVLQHKQGLLEEWEWEDEVWQLQADTWAKKCTICRIRDGRRVKHDWRECTVYPQDRAAVEEAHKEVEKGILSVKHEQEMNGMCGGCGVSRTRCWLQIKDGAGKMVCKYQAVVTESVAGILGIGPEMVGEWERREGRRRGGGVSEGHWYAGHRFGGIAVCRIWRTFGWAGVWDIGAAKADGVREEYRERLQLLTQQREGELEGVEQRKGLYGVREGKVGGWKVQG